MSDYVYALLRERGLRSKQNIEILTYNNGRGIFPTWFRRTVALDIQAERIGGRAVEPKGVQMSTDGRLGVDYQGFLRVPESGVYTFRAPDELVTSPQEPGYLLRVFLGLNEDGQLCEWKPATTRQGYGTWSIALKKGLHPFRVTYADYRGDAVGRLNHPGLRLNTIWEGVVPALYLSGPSMGNPQPIPASFLYRAPL